MKRMYIDGLCYWSVYWIREDASQKADENSKYGPTEAVDGPSFHGWAISGVVD